ncbi:MAG: hypothetical protein K8R21_05555 [Leptospira sp.]|nr:hypothetical protein [Leptospira sp.]
MEGIKSETAFRLYLDSSDSQDSDREIFSLILNYLGHLSDEESGEDILLEDFSMYEVDDFLNFYLPDNFESESEMLQKKSKDLLEKFLKFALKKKLMSSEQKEEWREILRS